MKPPQAPVARQVALIAAGVIPLVAASVIAGLVVAGHWAGSLRAQGQSAHSLAGVARRTAVDIAGSQRAAAAYVLTSDPLAQRLYRQAGSRFAARSARLARHAPADLQGLVRAQTRAGRAWFALAGPALAGSAPHGPAAARQLATRSRGALRAFAAANSALTRRLTSRAGRLLADSQRTLDTGRTVAVTAEIAAVTWGLAGAVLVVISITTPLRGLQAVIRQRRAGGTSARAALTGTVDVQVVAREFNALADENDRFRAEAEQRMRLHAAAHEAGRRIREHLSQEAVLDEARRTVETSLGADLAYLHLFDEQGRIGLPVGHEDDWIMPPGFINAMSPYDRVGELLRQGKMLVAQDIRGPGSEFIPPPVREALAAAGIAGILLAPFGAEPTQLGFLVALRLTRGHPWTQAESEAVESVAADIGHGLLHARQFQREKDLVDQLTALSEMRTEFFTTVAHELRAPLTSIEGYVEMLGEETSGPVTPGQREMLAAIDRGAGRLRALVEDLLTLARVESAAAAPATAPVDLAPVVAAAEESIRPAAAKAGLTLTITCPPRGPVVAGDAGQLGRALDNLLSNAVKYTPGGGQVGLTVAARDGEAVVTVRDTGIGIPGAEQDRLFSRFFRASNARQRKVPGTGLGLAIVRAIVTSHRGRISVESREGAGTTVTLRLPLAGQGGAPAPGPAGQLVTR